MYIVQREYRHTYVIEYLNKIIANILSKLRMVHDNCHQYLDFVVFSVQLILSDVSCAFELCLFSI